MEKRNFVTSIRTAESSTSIDDIIDSTASCFSKSASTVKKQNDFEKKGSVEDEKSDFE